MGGPRPAECVDRLRDRGIRGVHGNTDDFDLGRHTPPEFVRETSAWSRAQLSDDRAAWLAALPFSQRVSPTGNASDDLLIVHANPLDLNRVLHPPVEIQAGTRDGVKQTDEQAMELIGGVEAAVLAYGHLHRPNLRRIGPLLLANISSVSLPMDGDPRAKYGVCTWTAAEGWRVEHRRVAYDVEAEARVLESVRPPGWERFRVR